VSQKNNTDVAHYNFNAPQPISLIFAQIFNQSINQSKFIFWATEILQCIQCMPAVKRLPEKHTLIKLAAQTNKRTQILIIQTGRGKRQGGTNNNMCSASASGDIAEWVHYRMVICYSTSHNWCLSNTWGNMNRRNCIFSVILSTASALACYIFDTYQPVLIFFCKQ